jgi:hypothetical protein
MQRLRASGTLGVFPRHPGRDTEARSQGRLPSPVGRCYADGPAQQLFSHLPVRGNADWTPPRLTWMSVVMSWDEGPNLTTRWEHACHAAQDLPPHWRLGTSYAGFTQALVRQTPRLADALKRRFQRPMQACAGAFGRRGRWLAFAGDGTRIEASHTGANETELGCAGRAKTAPPVFLTVLWHMGLGWPWDDRVGPGTASQRTPMKSMVAAVPPGSLGVADAGFVGYGLCLRRLRHGSHFLWRVGGHITLWTGWGSSSEERDGLVSLWPHQHRGGRPGVLRLIVRRQGKQNVSLLTKILDPVCRNDTEAAEVVGIRWGEELFSRSSKPTLQRRRLRSRTAPTCLAEAQWTLLGLGRLGLLTVSRRVSAGVDPLALSLAQVRDAVRVAWRHPRPRRGPRSREAAVRAATKDASRRGGSKAARNSPRKKGEKPPGPPQIQSATEAEIKRAQGFPPPEIPLRWTA